MAGSALRCDIDAAAPSSLWRDPDAAPTGRLLQCADYLPEGSGAVTTGDVAQLLLELATAPDAKSGRIGVNSPVTR